MYFTLNLIPSTQNLRRFPLIMTLEEFLLWIQNKMKYTGNGLSQTVYVP